MDRDMSGMFEVGPCKRLVLLGGGDLLVRVAAWAVKNEWDVHVVTSPRHAEEAVGGEPLTATLETLSIDTYVWEDLDTERVRGLVGDPLSTLSISLGAAWIFTSDLIDGVFGSRLLNVHGTRLPRDRGGGTFSWQILQGAQVGTCLLHLVDAGVDTGDIVAVREFLYPPAARTPADRMAFYSDRNFEFITEAMTRIRRAPQVFSRRSQPEYLSSYWPRLHTPTHGWIDWSLPIDALERFICAFDEPYAGGRTLLAGQVVILRGAQADLSEAGFHPAQYGIVFRVNDQWASVAAKGGTLCVRSIETESGERRVPSIGDRLTTPAERLRQGRVAYTPQGVRGAAKD